MEDIVFQMLRVKPTGKISLGRHSHRWEDNISTGVKEIGVSLRNSRNQFIIVARNFGFP